AGEGRLSARPRSGIVTSGEGRRALGLDRPRDAILQLPSTLRQAQGEAARPLPLLVLFHGASGSGEGMLRRVGPAADEAGIAVLAPDSRDGTWDAIRGDFSVDVAFIDRALARVFETVAIDPDRVVAGRGSPAGRLA